MPLQTGQVLNKRYRIVTLLGQGGFGAVYRAWDMNLGKPCALKENLETSQDAQRQFAREASVLASITHPNLPRVSDHFSIPGQGQYLVMDFVEGEDLATLMGRQGAVPTQQALAWINQVADALTYLHTQKKPIVHRDIKPANIRITPDGKAMLVDFGLFKFYEPSKRTTIGARAITPGYAPPEQYGMGVTDPRTDIYALAATLYALVTGREPMESVIRVTGQQLPPAQQVNPNVPAHIGQVIERAMHLEPGQRFQSVADFKAALNVTQPHAKADEVDQTLIVGHPQSVLETQLAARPAQAPTMRPMQAQPSAAAHPQSAAPQAAYPAPSAYPPPAGAPDLFAPQAKRKGSKVWIVVLGLLLSVVVIVLGAWYLTQEGVSEETPDDIPATVAAASRATSTARVQATATARALLNVEAGWELVFGPVDGRLIHNPGDGLIKANQASINVDDFVAEAVFINPYAISVGAWDYGFIFRHASANQHFRLLVHSDKTWLLRNNVGAPDGSIIAQGEIPSLDISEGGSNHIKLICNGDRGEFYINDIFIAELDLSERANSGDVIIATGVLDVDQVEGYVTEYRNFIVWALPSSD